jgi:polyribonucleotide nucleotidyltransferase
VYARNNKETSQSGDANKKEYMLQHKYSVEVEDLGIKIGTGTIGKQANGAVMISLGETTVFVAAVAAASVKEGQDFFPLTVDYRERFAAAGRFPGGFFKREGRPSEKEILTSRLCDRPLRPLFPKGFMNEVQVQGLLLSADGQNDPDMLMVNGASAALICSDIPWGGPVGGVRVGYINGEFVTNPTHEQMFESELDLVYVGNEKEMMMIEGGADQLSEEKFIEALEYAQTQVVKIIDAQKKLAEMFHKEKANFDLFVCTEENLAFVRKLVGKRLLEAVFQESKIARNKAVEALKKEAAEALKAKVGEENFDKNQIMLAFEVLQEEVFRDAILDEGKRADGRGVKDLRPITGQAGVLPRVHGSAMFQRGETQNIAIATLGTTSDVQEMDGITGGPREKSFILHYNFPNYSVGETGRISGPGRREIGHGNLAERSLLPIIPGEDVFPYSIRIVSEIMESNGSTSMASVCGGCLALMDAGVPITDMVAGISCGLVTRKNKKGEIVKHVVLTDIIGSEDHFGDMDFKICGTKNGITGFQLDLKIAGIPHDIAVEAIKRNTQTRMKILDIMSEILPESRKELSEHAPRIQQIQIDPEKIGLLIGPGGKTIRRITEVSGAQIDINEDNSGRVNIYATTKESMDRALEEIALLTAEIEVGKTYRGIVRGVKEFGAFVECLPGKEGLVHVSELADFRVNRVEDVCAMGDEMWVKCVGIDEKGRVRLSRKEAMAERDGEADGLSEKLAAEKARAGDRPQREDRGERRDDRRGDRGDRGERRGDRGDRRGDRGERRSFRDDRGERPARDDRDERPAPAREDRPYREDREERPAREDDRPVRESNEDEDYRPARREDRAERPAREEVRGERPARRPREDRPAREDDRPARPADDRDERPARDADDDREERPASDGDEPRRETAEGSERPSRREGDDNRRRRPARDDRSRRRD